MERERERGGEGGGADRQTQKGGVSDKRTDRETGGQIDKLAGR